MMHLKWLFWLSLIGLCAATPPKIIEVDLDNPLTDTLWVNMDGLTLYKVAPNTLKRIKIKAGKHSFDVKVQGKIVHSGLFDSPTHGLLNISQSEYVVWKDIYMKEEREEYYENIDEKVVFIDNQEYIGDIKLFGKDAIFIPREWDYDTETSFPQDVKLNGKPFLLKKKIYYKRDFIREYRNG